MNLDGSESMNSNAWFPYHGHNLPAAAGMLAGMVFLFLVSKAERRMMKLVLFLSAAALFAAAYWWATHIRN